MAGRVRVGTSGFAYDDWVGPFYPARLASERHEWLAYYADHFPTVEINSSFYSMPTDPTVQAWVAKARGRDLEFALKVPRTVTHRALVDGDGDAAGRELDALLAVTAPLADEGRRGPFLFQLSPGLRRGAASAHALAAALRRVRDAGAAVAVEFRHDSWLDRETGDLAFDAKRLLKDHDAALVSTDGPGFPALHAATATHAYVRFHGRNRDLWFRGGVDRDEEEANLRAGPRPDGPITRYDYLYNATELTPWARRVGEIARAAKEVRVFFNNHPGGKAAKNALQFMDMLGVPHKAKDVRLQAQERLDRYEA